MLFSEACTNMLLTLRGINESHHHRADYKTEEPQRQQKWKNEADYKTSKTHSRAFLFSLKLLHVFV